MTSSRAMCRGSRDISSPSRSHRKTRTPGSGPGQGASDVMRRILVVLPLVVLAGPAGAQQPDDINRVIDQGLSHSQVMQTAEHLMDQIGGRMTNSPQMRQAEAWTQQQFKSWGLRN